MSFLNPLGLLLAGLAAVPLLLHLLRRQSVQRIAFPALRYLRDAEQRTSRSLRLRDLLLLATRVGLLVLLAVAAARPLAGRGDADDHAPTDVILLMDNSASMGRVVDGRTLLEHQLDAARAALGHATPADRFWVMPAAGPPLAAGVDAETADAALDSLSVTGAGADLVGRIEEATSAVPVEEGRAREVQLYTDRQASALAGGPLDLSAWGRVAVSMPDDDPPDNLFVADLRLEPDGPVVPGDPPAAAVRVASDAEGTGGGADTVEVRVLVDGRTVAVARTVAGSEVLVSLPDLEPGAHDLRAEGPPSGLRADDARQAGIVVERPPGVRFLGDPDGFLATALTTLTSEGRLRDPDGDAVTVVEGAAEPTPAGGRAVVLVPPAELTRLPAFQQRLDALSVPWRLAGRSGAGDLRFADDDDVPGLAEVRVTLAHGLERLAAPATVDDSVLL
ncbi:MAG: BatA domain-containing protein, partial [Gemmatimonadota bacterium]